ncbi:IPT/TIG domain-containing protein [Chitinophaga qingshengii]|uniref:IPT/TIG domain-containing protein n=1 Tax=Chitinophaga qingshengii TaxID=1569794 RepID=A0ABR7TPA2_9BACT|nr:IPT/TIG domain-containing protein [Chitinophaga qingshengii]
MLAQTSISAVIPRSASPGEVVTLQGNNFGTDNVVYFGAVKAAVVSTSSNNLTVMVPAGATYAPVSVLNTSTGLTGYSAQPFLPTYPGITGENALIKQVPGPGTYFSTGGGPSKMAVGDLDGDGKPDIVSANYYDGTVSVLRNTAVNGSINDNSFAPHIDIAAGDRYNTVNVALSDLNGDGKLDLVAININGGKLVVFENNSTIGNIVFTQKASYFNISYAVEIGDIDADGRPDILFAIGYGQLGILMNTITKGPITQGSFAGPYRITSSGSMNDLIQSIAVADLDGDGKQDVITVAPGLNGLSIIRNITTSGQPAFSAPIDIPTGNGPQFVVAGDIDGDQRPDLVVANTKGGTVSVFRNKATPGGLTAASFENKIDYVSGDGPNTIAIGDIDGDGKPDICVGNYNSSTVAVFKNKAVAGTLDQQSLTKHLINEFSYGLNVADINGDGHPELILASFGQNMVNVVQVQNLTGPPKVDSFRPDTASLGSTITLRGSGFAGVSSVQLGGKEATSFKILSDSIITAVVPATTSGGIQVTGPLGTGNATGFIYIPPPELSAFNPASAGEGDIITITGRYLSTVNQITIGDVPVTAFQVLADDKIQATVGKGASGTIVVTGLAANKASIAGFTFIPPPSLYRIIPKAAAAGDTIAIHGAFINTATSITLGGVNVLSFQVVNDTTIKAVVGNTVSGDVTLTTPRGSATLSGFKFIGIPVINRFYPVTGSFAATVTIKGDSFTGATGVTLGGVAASSFTVVSDSVITAVVGTGNAGKITVTTNRGIASVDGFGYVVAPVITNVSPLVAPVGATVVITGQHFDPVASNNVVYFGPVKAHVSSATANSLSVVVPSGASYRYVTVTTNGLTAISTKQFSTAFSNGGNITAASFSPRIDLPAPKEILYVSLADIDGDGLVDLISSGGGTQVEVCRNTSSGKNITFETPVTLQEDKFSIRNIQTGDIDGDGKLDIIVSVYGGGKICVFRNISTQGHIAFEPVVDVEVDSRASGVVVADFDNDGRVDIAVNSDLGYRVCVLRSISAPGYLAFIRSDFNAGNSPAKLAVGDLDGDGKPDLVQSNVSSSYLSVLLNKSKPGDIQFAHDITYDAGTWSDGVFVGDVDSDGRPEMLSANRGERTVSIYPNTTTDGKITFGTMMKMTAGERSEGVLMNDLNGDGKPEVVVYNRDGKSISLFENNSSPGNIALAAKVDLISGAMVYDIHSGDINGDGKQDIVMANAGWPVGSNLAVFLNLAGAAQAPVIDSITPGKGTAGTVVTIYGKHFTGATAVSFGSVPATALTVVSDTVMTATVGNGSTGEVVVTTPDGTISYKSFTYLQPVPEVSAFTPAGGIEGTDVTITGTGFTGATTVSFGGVPASVFTVVADTVITARVGKGATGNVVVMTGSGADTLGGFTYLAPSILSFSPAIYTPGQQVTITGINFNGATNVSFGGTPASSFVVVSDAIITAVPGNGTSGVVQVTTPNGIALLDGFIYRPLPAASPRIKAFDPQEGTSGTVVTIRGTGFSNTTSVSFGGTAAASFTILSDSIIHAVVGGGSTGLVRVVNAVGADTMGTFQVIKPPVIFSFNPVTAEQGATITIRGNNLKDVTAVSFGGVAAASWQIVSENEMVAVVGLGESGAVQVSTKGGTTALEGFIFKRPVPAPYIGDFLPKSAQTGISVKIYGNNFTDVTAVSFGDVPAASFQVASDSVINATIGNGATGAVSITTRTGKTAMPGFTFIQSPVMTGFYPAEGKTGTSITIRGHNFANVVQVSFGTSPALNFQVLSDSVITATVGEGASGNVKIVMNDRTLSLPGFVYLPVTPAIGKVWPPSGTEGTNVIIWGDNLGEVTAVYFGNMPATAFHIISDHEINAIVGAGETGPVSLRFKNGAPLSGPIFEYLPPAIFEFSPVEAMEGATVRIRGRGLSGATGVTFGGMPARTFNVMNDSTMIAIVGAGASGLVQVNKKDRQLILNGFTFIQPATPAPEENISVYPNPAIGAIWLEHPVSAGPANVQILDMMGNVVKTLTTGAGESKTQVNLTGLKMGYYTFVWRDGSRVSTKVFLVAQ